MPVALSKARMFLPSCPMILPRTLLPEGSSNWLTVRSALNSEAARSTAREMILTASASAFCCASSLIFLIRAAAS